MTRREGQPEEVEHEQHDGLRAQTTPPPGVRPGVLLDPGPPGDEAVAVGYAAASVPLLGAPSLADSSAEAIDGSTLSFLLQRALGRQEEGGGGGGGDRRWRAGEAGSEACCGGGAAA